MLQLSPDLLQTKDQNEATAMHYAARWNHIIALEFIIKQNPSFLKAIDNLGKTTLDYAYKIETQNYLRTKDLELIEVPSTNSNINNDSLPNTSIQCNTILSSLNNIFFEDSFKSNQNITKDYEVLKKFYDEKIKS